MPSPAVTLEQPVIDLLGRGVASVVGTASEAGEPEICRAWGLCWRAAAGQLEALLPLPAARRSLDNLERNPNIAFTFSRPTDYECYQLKGRVQQAREPEAEHWRLARAHFDAFVAEASRVGLEPAAVAPWFPAQGRVVVAAIDSIYAKTPGPGAGRRL